MSDSSNTDLISKGFSALDFAWALVLDKAKGLPLGTTIVTKYGVLASGLGGLAAAEKFGNSPQTSSDLDLFMIEIAGQIPGIPGISMSAVGFIHEKISEIFDGGANEAALLSKLINFSNQIKKLPGMVATEIDKITSTIQTLQEMNFSSLAPQLTINQYTMGGNEFFHTK